MNNQLKPLNILVSLGIITILIPGYTPSAVAQYESSGEPVYQSNEKDSLFGDSVTGLDPMQLIHRANLSNGRSFEEFNQESSLQIQDSASQFKLLQQQKILEQYQIQETETPAESIGE